MRQTHAEYPSMSAFKPPSFIGFSCFPGNIVFYLLPVINSVCYSNLWQKNIIPVCLILYNHALSYSVPELSYLLKLSICKIQNEQISIQSSFNTKSEEFLQLYLFSTSWILFMYVKIFSRTCISLPNVLLNQFLLPSFYLHFNLIALFNQGFYFDLKV